MKHRYSDQYARLEGMRTYIRAAAKMLSEFRTAEESAIESRIGEAHIDEMMGFLKASEEACQDMVDSIAAEAAHEGSDRETVPPLPSWGLDEPFAGEKK